MLKWDNLKLSIVTLPDEVLLSDFEKFNNDVLYGGCIIDKGYRADGTMYMDITFTKVVMDNFFKIALPAKIAEVLSGHILRVWQDFYIDKAVNKYCKGNMDKQRVSARVRKELGEVRNGLRLFEYEGRRSRVSSLIFEILQKDLIDTMDNTCFIDVGGFLTFKGAYFKKDINFMTELVLEELKNEAEYVEFLRLLKYFIHTSVTSQIQEVHIQRDTSGYFQVYDENGNVFINPIIGDYLDLFSDSDPSKITVDDVVVSVLISANPKRVVLHGLRVWDKESYYGMLLDEFGDVISVSDDSFVVKNHIGSHTNSKRGNKFR